MIKFIFVLSDGSSGLAHDPLHRVIGLTLPPIDANTFFITVLSLSETLEKIWLVDKNVCYDWFVGSNFVYQVIVRLVGNPCWLSNNGTVWSWVSCVKHQYFRHQSL